MIGQIFALIMSVLGLPLMMTAVGGVYTGGGAPKHINEFSGYRTERSMQNQRRGILRRNSSAAYGRFAGL